MLWKLQSNFNTFTRMLDVMTTFFFSRVLGSDLLESGLESRKEGKDMRFRPCIDLKGGNITQIVGGSLDKEGNAVENFVSREKPSYYAKLYERDGLFGGHVIMLGPGNEEMAKEALAAFPGGFQVGGGVTAANACQWLEAGASHVIATSFIFHDGTFDRERLAQLIQAVGGKHRLVLDLSCRKKKDGNYYVVTDRWQKFTTMRVDADTLIELGNHCAEFLVHGVDVEGKRLGVDGDLVSILGIHSPLPVTYAGGARSIQDFELVRNLGRGRVDLTVGSALDIFGGDLPYAHVVQWHQQQNPSSQFCNKDVK